MALTNKEFANSDPGFLEACARVQLKPTKRQASRWRNRKGIAFKEGKLKKKGG
jgi:hypothetical protein